MLKIVIIFVRQFEKNKEMKKQIYRYAALALLGILPTMLHAQVNSKPAFVITNENDTIYGTIDYLSDTKNANECRFKADGATDFKVYKPGDISGYRLTDNGIFYVTKTFSIEGEPRTIFVEYLLQGGVNLFHHKEGVVDYYFFTDRDGKTASVKNVGSLLRYSSRTETKDNKRAALREVSQMLAESSKAQHDLWEEDITANNLTKIAYDYNMEFCTTPKTAKLKYLDLGLQVGAAYSLMPEWKVSPVLRGGVNVGQIVSGSQENLTSFSISNGELNLSNIGYYVGAGFDIPIQKHVLRVSAEYKRTRTSHSKMTISHVAVNAGIRL